MRALWLDPFAGISGDMFLGALLDLGLSLDHLNADLKALRIAGLRVARRRVRRGPLSASRALIRLPRQPHEARNLRDIRRLLGHSALTPAVRRRAAAVFTRLARAEAEVHRLPLERVHFHEVGALDALADVVGVCSALERLHIERLYTARINVGGGLTGSRHGTLPVPAPATLALLQGYEIFRDGPLGEHATPTGAALLASLADSRPAWPGARLEAVGYGAGERDWPDFPNVLRIWLGETRHPAAGPTESDEVAVLTATLDDAAPQVLAYAQELLLAQGALDVTLQALFMKKGRIGTRCEILCKPEQAAGLAEVLFRETPTLGLRLDRQQRMVLTRKTLRLRIRGQRLRVKVGYFGGKPVTLSPEFEDAKVCAQRTGLPLREILENARRQAKEIL